MMKRFSIVLLTSALVSGLSLVGLGSAAAEGKCGKKGQPMCPLQGWMEENVQKPMDKGDWKAVSKAMKKAAGMAPDASWNEGDKSWKKMAEESAKAAASGDEKAIKATCKSCHKAWRKKYRKEFREKPVKG
ncbi:MAG: hypothetical protein OXT09_28800 [Myxococcales bacterium]|nr:hypothetical protein [Myxococcales bacterium]